jgi:hypothetical protein
MSTYNKFAKYLTMMAVMLAATTACEDVDDDGDIFNVQPDGEMIDPDAPGIDDVSPIPLTRYTVRMETPALKPGNLFVEHSTFERDDSLVNYMLEYSPEHFMPRWVAFRFDSRNRATVANRKSYSIKPQFPADPDLGSYGLKSDAPFNGFQHGHLGDQLDDGKCSRYHGSRDAAHHNSSVVLRLRKPVRRRGGVTEAHYGAEGGQLHKPFQGIAPQKRDSS